MSDSPVMLGRLIERLASLAGPRHRELVRAMVAELDAVTEPAERRRFAAGAVAAIVRLALRRSRVASVDVLRRIIVGPVPNAPLYCEGSPMPMLSTTQLLRRHVVPFGVALATLTSLLLFTFALDQLPALSARGASMKTLLEAILLAMPFTMAMTIPMAVFLAVSWVFTRLGLEGMLATAQRERHGVRRLIVPVLGGAAMIAALTLVSNTAMVPRANARLAAVLAGRSVGQSDRTMTIAELREEAQLARTMAGPDASARAAAYEVEVQKKFALAAACLVLALVGTTTALRFPRGGLALVLGAGGVVFTGYYMVLVAGEGLADALVMSPFAAMWMANALLLAVGLLLARRPRGTDRGAASVPTS